MHVSLSGFLGLKLQDKRRQLWRNAFVRSSSSSLTKDSIKTADTGGPLLLFWLQLYEREALPMGWNVHVSVNVLRKSSSRQTDRQTHRRMDIWWSCPRWECVCECGCHRVTKSSVKRTYRTYVFYIPTVPIARRRHSYVRETERETHTQLPSQKIIWESEKK